MFKRAQVSTGISWFIATMIIIFILGISIYISSFAELFSRSFVVDNSNLFVTKSLSGYLLNDGCGENIFSLIKENKDIYDCEGNQLVKISNKLYSIDGDDVYVCAGINNFKSNFFGTCIPNPYTRTLYFERFKIDESTTIHFFGRYRN